MARKHGPHAVTNGCYPVGTDHAVIEGSAKTNGVNLHVFAFACTERNIP